MIRKYKVRIKSEWGHTLVQIRKIEIDIAGVDLRPGDSLEIISEVL